MNRFENKTVLITGAVGGMGASHARNFHKEGANVVITDIREEEGRALAAELGDRALFVRLDVTAQADWATAIRAAETTFGPVSVLVNNAGVLSPAALIEDYDFAAWQQVIDVNLTGTWLGIQAAAPSLRAAGGGAIVNIASTSGMVGTSLIAPYVASKWGVRGLTRTAAMELARDGVRVNSINPGVVNTPLITEPLHPGAAPVSDYYSPDAFAIKRLADPQEISNLLLFLASDEASFITGSDYVADGGMLLGPALADSRNQNRS
ncbi:SDR family NAD(P)-dependent oxidoreductase [Streptomyces sp. NPDC057062]|uniref:SDR family NAD(P)-dependent oxidoreductase n=1 Tax=Streptomyces sp. NPDC057062 TaxID=3346011 RepID=UPI00363E6EB8